MRLDIWADVPRIPQDLDVIPEWAERFKLMGANAVSIVLNQGIDPVWKPTYSHDQVSVASLELQKRGISVRWMSYPTKWRIDLETLAVWYQTMYAFAEEEGVDAVAIPPELDLEEQIAKVKKEDLLHFIEMLLEIPQVSAVHINGVPKLNSELRDPCAWALEVEGVTTWYPQAYTTNTNDGNPAFNPGGAYIDAAAKAIARYPDKAVIPGLAFYGQNYAPPLPSGIQAIETTRKKWEEAYNVSRMVVWSEKWVVNDPERASYFAIVTGARDPQLPPGDWGMQWALAELGYYTGEIDGIWGPRSKEAYLSYSSARVGVVEADYPDFDGCRAMLDDLFAQQN